MQTLTFPLIGSAKRPGVLVAMVLGTALSTVAAPETAAARTPDATLQAIADINRYCTVCWRNARLDPTFWSDCTQEVLCRLLERVAPEAWNRILREDGEERREFLRAIDTVKKRVQRSRKFLGLNDLTADSRDQRERYLAEERAAVRDAAARLLSLRQQRILEMSFDGWSVQDIATELDTPPERVSDEKYKAIRKLREHLGAADSPA
jgi:RNA polymerase sigma factor (sigma-70 family)